MGHILSVLLIAEITGRIPIIHWGGKSLFRDPGAGPDSNAFDLYWEPLNDADIGDFTGKDLSYFPGDWSAETCRSELPDNAAGRHLRSTGEEFLDRNEDVVVSTTHMELKGLVKYLPKSSPLSGPATADIYRSLWQNQLRPLPHLVSRTQKFVDENFSNHSVIAVHARGSDKSDEAGSGLNSVTEYYYDILDPIRNNWDWRIFVLTESEVLLDLFKERYGDQVLYTDIYRTSGDVGIHYHQDAGGRRLGEEVLVDTLIALEADRFVGNGLSNVSCAIDVFKNWKSMESGLIVANHWI